MKYKYGEYGNKQMQDLKESIRKQIFFLLLIVDPKTREEYTNVDVNAAFDSLLRSLGGLNQLLGEPIELVNVMMLVQAAWTEYNSPDYKYSNYRRLVLAAGSDVLKIKEV